MGYTGTFKFALKEKIQFLKNQYLRVTNNRQSRPAQILIPDCVSCLNLGRFRVIDRRNLWYGNINFTGGNYPDDNTMRIIEPAVASEVMGYLMEGE